MRPPPPLKGYGHKKFVMIDVSMFIIKICDSN